VSDPRYPTASSDSRGEPTRSSIEAELAERKDAIQRRIDDIEDEIVSAPAAIKSSIVKHPLVGLAGALAAGLVVGLIVTRRRKPDLAPLHQRLVDEYVDALGEDVSHRVRRGRTIEESVRRAMRDRTPLIVYSPGASVESAGKGYLSKIIDFAFKAAMGFAVKGVLDVASSALDVEALLQMVTAEAEAGAGTAAGAAQSGGGAAGTVEAAEAW
jgi:ElaB/YqjD/DUF883 family membrane-anchored ribosome-binding protein